MYPYEGMFLVDPVAHTEDPQAVQTAVSDLLKKHGAEIVHFDLWEERKLAYEIKGHKRGIYLLTYFKMPGGHVDALRRECNITEVILRELVIRLPWEIETYLEKKKFYDEKIREDHEARQRGREAREGRDRPRGDRPDRGSEKEVDA